MIETERLLLRPWEVADAQALYAVAKDPLIGPPAGWPPHESAQMSREVIETVFSLPETYAIAMRDSGRIVGCVGLLFGANGNVPMAEGDGQAEIGYWVGSAWWGLGIAPEAARALIRHAFDDLGIRTIWATLRADNAKSRRVLDKLGFSYARTDPAVPCEVAGDRCDQVVMRLDVVSAELS